MTISAKLIRQPTRTYYCDWCERPITGPYLSLYGRAHETEKPYTLRLHPTEQCCPNHGGDPKIAAALDLASA